MYSTGELVFWMVFMVVLTVSIAKVMKDNKEESK